MPKVVFVCTGNTCRSPMAEHLFRRMLREEGVEDWEVASAGVAAQKGLSPSLKTVSILEDEGINGARMHRTTPLSECSLDAGDLVLTMTRAHRSRIHPDLIDDSITVDTLKDYVGRSGGFADPYGGDLEEYRELKREMIPVLRELLDRLRSSSSNET